MSQKNADFRTPYARAAGLGSAKDGVGHWWSQRVTAVALILLGKVLEARAKGRTSDAIRSLMRLQLFCRTA